MRFIALFPFLKNPLIASSAVGQIRENQPFVYAAKEQLPTETTEEKCVSLNYRIAIAEKLISRQKRQTDVTVTEVPSDEIWGHPHFDHHRDTARELLMQYKWKLEVRLEALNIQCSTRNALCALGHSLLQSIAINIRQIQRATSLREMRQLLDKLQSFTLDICLRIQNIASPPLLADFVKLRTDIFLELAVSQFDHSQLITQKKEIIARIQKLTARIEDSQNASAGQLSREFIHKLAWGYRERSNHMLLAKSTIEHAQTNDEIAQALNILRRSISRSNWILKSVLRSPEHNLQEQAFLFLGKLYALRTNLGEEAPVA